MAKDLINELDRSYNIPLQIGITSEHTPTDFRNNCDSVNDFDIAATQGFDMRYHGLITTETSTGLTKVCKLVDGNYIWEVVGAGSSSNGNSSIHISDTMPSDNNLVWIDTNNEALNASLNSDIVEEVRLAMASLNNKLDDINYALSYELDPGYFNGLFPGTNPDDEINNEENGGSGTVGHVLLKRGYKNDIEQLQEGELGFCIDTEELYVGNKGRLRLLAKVGGTGGGSNGGNVTADYLELISPNKTKYRLTVNDDGKVQIYNSIVDTAPDPEPTDSGRFKGLIINKVYGGGTSNTNSTPSSHSFIELYNSSENTINLKGLSLQYGEHTKEWMSLPLRGIVKPYTSFLIRCAEHTDINRTSTRFKISDFDMTWDIPISDNGFKVYLKVGTEPSQFVNPANTDGIWTKEIGYIDLFAAGGVDVARIIDGYEKNYLHIVNKDRMIKRVDSQKVNMVFADTDNNAADLWYIDLRTANVDIYKPRSSSYGQWNYYYDKKPLDKLAPNMISICFGQDGDTTRTFTWQSEVTNKGYLKYKKKDTSNWITVPTDKRIIAHHDTDVTIHSVIIRNLTPGTYIYKAGEEGRWSDEYELEVLDATDTSRPIRMLQVSDQQGWNEEEYSAWGKANKFIEENEEYDFILNTGVSVAPYIS